jgi:hypothetical protein
MRSPTQVIWNVIGDIFGRAFQSTDRRSIDLFWQSLFEASKDTFAYTDFYQKSKNVFEVEPYAPWGTYKVELTEVEELLSSYGIVLGGKTVSERWRWVGYTTSDVVPSTSGLFGVFNSGIEYDLRQSVPLQSGGQVLEFTGQKFVPYSEFDNKSTSSYVFGEESIVDNSARWSITGSRYPTVTSGGIFFNPSWVNWSLLADNYHISGNSNWTQKWIIKVTKWDPTSILRAMSVISKGDVGADFEVRLYDSGNEVKVSMGQLGRTRGNNLFFLDNEIRRERGSFIFDGFEVGQNIIISGSDYDGSYTIENLTTQLMTLLEDNPFGLTETPQHEATIRSSLEVGLGNSSNWQNVLESATEESPVQVEFVVSYDAVNASLYSEVWLDNTVIKQITPYRVAAGRRSHIFDIFNQYKDVEVYLKYIVSNGDLWEGDNSLDLSASWGNSYKFVYESTEPIVQSSQIRTEAFNLGNPSELISWDGTDMAVSIDENWNGYASQYVRITYDASWATFEKISTSDTRVTYRKIASNDVNFTPKSNVILTPLFLNDNEFKWISSGRLTTQFALPTTSVWSIDTLAKELDMYDRYGRVLGISEEEDSKSYLDKIRGYQSGVYSAPSYYNIARSVGMIVGSPYATEAGVIESITPMGEYDLVVIGSKEYRIDPFWRTEGLLKRRGQFVDKLDLMVTGVKVDDYKSNYELVKSYVKSIWNSWGTFVVRIPAKIGSDTSGMDGVVGLLQRIKNKRTDFIVRFESSSQEDMRDGYSDGYENTTTNTSYAHTIEDSVMFDDGGAVLMNGTNYQTIGGLLYSEEYQNGITTYLDDGLTLDQFNQLDAFLSINDVRKNNDGSYIYRNQGIDIKRSLDSAESALELSRVRMRTSPTRGNYNASETLWTIDPVTELHLSPHVQAWTSLGIVTTSETYVELWDDNPVYGIVCSATGEAFITNDYFYNWNTFAIGTTRAVSNNPLQYAWFLQNSGNILVSDYSAVAPTTPITYGFNAPTTVQDFVGAEWYALDYGWIISTDGIDINSYYSNDSGGSWTAASLIDSGSLIFQDIQFLDASIGFVFLNEAIYKTVDAGTTWTLHSSPLDVQCGYVIDEDNLIVGTSSGASKYVEGSGYTAITDLSGEDIRSISGDGNSRISVCGVNGLFHSFDYGDTWVENLATAFTLDDISIVGNTLGLTAGNGNVYRYY